jgi:hypothetical protein
MTESPAPDARLKELLAPLLAKVASLEPHERRDPEAIQDLEEQMEASFPFSGEHIQALGTEIAQGVRDGWLCNRGEADSRFSRVAKPSDTTHGLSVDCVSMTGSAVDHTHTKGEVTVGFPAEGADADAVRFEGRPAGWVFLGPGSRHRPQVDGGRMNLIYFLPDGAVEWHM